MKPIRFVIRCSVLTIRTPFRMACKAARMSVDAAKELHEAVKAGLSDRMLDRAAKNYGKRNVFQEIG